MKLLIVLPRGKKGEVTYPCKVFSDKTVLLLFLGALEIKPRVSDMPYKCCTTEQISLHSCCERNLDDAHLWSIEVDASDTWFRSSRL